MQKKRYSQRVYKVYIFPYCYTVPGYVCNVAYGYKTGHLGCYRYTGFTGAGNSRQLYTFQTAGFQKQEKLIIQ